MKKLNKKVSKGKELSFDELCSINSYNGWIKWCNGYNLNKKYIYPLKNK